MVRSVKVNIGKGDDSADGKPPESAVRLPVELLSRIDVWAGEHDASPRAEAIRRLVELGLTVKAKRTLSGQQRARAATLAGRQIDQMGDTSATTEENAHRKRRLTEGPSMVREVRHDRLTKKALT